MKKTILTLIAASLLTAAFTVPALAELRPTQKVMQARAGWLKAMNEDLAGKKLAAVAKNASELSAQTAQIGKSLQGERQELTLKVSALAKAAADAAAKNDAPAVQAKLGEIKGTCTTCHDKYRK